MTKTINILGDTQKEQWLSAINILSFAIVGNIDHAIEMRLQEEPSCIYFDALGDEDDEVFESLERAKRMCGEFADEMRRLVDGVFE